MSRDEVRYHEGDHVLLFVAELMGKGEPSRIIYRDGIKRWLPPHENEEITEARRNEILRKICIYFDNNGHTYGIQ